MTNPNPDTTIVFNGFPVKQGDLFLVTEHFTVYQYEEGYWDNIGGILIDLQKQDHVMVLQKEPIKSKFVKAMAIRKNDSIVLVQLLFERPSIMSALKRVSCHCDE